jgi:hypothetical protein
MTAIEHQQIKGITIKNLIVTIFSTITIVSSVLTSYFGIKADVAAVSAHQDSIDRVTEVRLKMLETEVYTLRAEVQYLKDIKPL